MTTKEYFNGIRKLKSRIQAKLTQAETMRELATNISPNYSGMPHEPTKSTSPMADAICKAIDLEKEAEQLKSLLVAKETEAMSLITNISNPDEQAVLIHRYLREEQWSDIAHKLHYAKSTIYRFHSNAVCHFNDILQTMRANESP